jgi:hypothetical protein
VFSESDAFDSSSDFVPSGIDETGTCSECSDFENTIRTSMLTSNVLLDCDAFSTNEDYEKLDTFFELKEFDDKDISNDFVFSEFDESDT